MSAVHGTVDGHPRPARGDAEAAAARIIARRRRMRDPHLERLPEDLLGVLEHVCRYRHLDPWIPPGTTPEQVRSMVREALADDFRDAWAIADYLDAAVDSARLALLDMITDAGNLRLAEIAPVVGVTTKQGVSELRFRLQAAVDGLPRDRHSASVARQAVSDHAAGLRNRADLLAAFARELLQHRTTLLKAVAGGPDSDVDGLRYDLDNLADQVARIRAGRPAPESLPIVLRLALEALDDLAPGWADTDPGLAAAVDVTRPYLAGGGTR
ncbi:hypothetical protein [Dactylosporangium sp. CS-033363]|uniref:hypothetical protein n=1 Tax=Dactylosporangium sp. CS-033363 TaxID=3239935 RepID=UPI003D8B1159